MESPSKCTWGATRTRCSLLGHLCPSSDLANHPLFPYPFYPARMAKPTTRLRYRLSAGPRTNAALHEASARIQAQWDHQENTCAQTPSQCIWPKTSRTCVE